MAIILFDFRPPSGASWTMQPACTNGTNPAPVTNAVIYIIHNQRTNGTYVGFAQNANHRWMTRTEVFHCFHIEPAYGADMLCACCIPHVYNPPPMPVPLPGAQLAGLNRPEHLLIRAVVNGLLGVTTCTNTALRGSLYIPPPAITGVEVHFPGGGNWGRLLNHRQAPLVRGTPY